MSKLIGFAIGSVDWACGFTVEVLLPGFAAGLFGLFCGLFAGLGLQLLLHLVGGAPSISSSQGTDWYTTVPMLLGAGAGIALGVESGIQQRRRHREQFDRLRGGGEG